MEVCTHTLKLFSDVFRPVIISCLNCRTVILGTVFYVPFGTDKSQENVSFMVFRWLIEISRLAFTRVIWEWFIENGLIFIFFFVWTGVHLHSTILSLGQVPPIGSKHQCVHVNLRLIFDFLKFRLCLSREKWSTVQVFRNIIFIQMWFRRKSIDFFQIYTPVLQSELYLCSKIMNILCTTYIDCLKGLL